MISLVELFKKKKKQKIKTSIDTEYRLIVSARGKEELEGGWTGDRGQLYGDRW